MTGRIFTADHHAYDLPALIAWNVTYTGTVPCDSFSVTFLYEPDMAPVLALAAGFAAIQDGKTVLRGIVDEYAVELNGDGLMATIVGRGYAARLLDNEARPITYQNATLAEIVRAHVTPYGISCGKLADLRATSVYTVASGSSQWKALEGFCRTYGGFSPRFAPNGELLAAPETAGRHFTVKAGDPVLSCTLREDHYGVLTEVLVIDKTRNVSYSVKNEEMLKKGGQCRRVVYTPGQSTWDAMRYTGEYQIGQSRREEKTVTVSLPGNFLAAPGDRLTLELPQGGLCGEFRVREAENAFSAERGATVKLTGEER